MNRARRKQIEGVIASLEVIQSAIEAQAEIIGDIFADEEEARDNIPESMQESDRFQAADDAANSLGSAHDDIQSFSFDDIISSLREAMA